MHKCKSTSIAVALIAAAATTTADEAEYTIENVVNSFDKERIEKTHVGYQYWFADKWNTPRTVDTTNV